MLVHLIHTTYGCLLVPGSVPALAWSPGFQGSWRGLGGRYTYTPWVLLGFQRRAKLILTGVRAQARQLPGGGIF